MPIPAASITPTVDELKTHLNEDSAENDAELAGFLDAAVTLIEGYVGPLDTAVVTETYYSQSPGLPLLLRQYPVVSVESIVDSNGDTVDPDTYTVDPNTGRVWMSRWSGALPGWAFWGPTLIDVTVSYTVGRATLPAPISMAILEVARDMWAGTQSGGGGRRFGQIAPDGEAFTAGRPALPPYARELLEPYLRTTGVA